MIERNIVETIYEYDKDGKLTRKSVTSCECQDKCGSCNDDF